jgi:molecular chaperone DnaK
MRQSTSKGVGIDLGTTNSVVAVLNPTDTDIVLHRDRNSKSPITPSCVWQDPRTGEVVVGRKAIARGGLALPPVRSVKRLMGKKQLVRLGNAEVTPEHVSSLILAEMKRQIEEDVEGWNTSARQWVVDRAIVTVPAYFDQPQIDATRRAAEMAGIELIDLLHEPTAAACYHCWRTGTRQGMFLVYDLGGGTFDVSIVRVTGGAFEILGISGDNRLGGDDIDTAVALTIAERLSDDGYAMDLDAGGDPADLARLNQLRFMAEGLKKSLSASGEYLLTGNMTDKNGAPVLVEMAWERADLDSIARPAVERTLHFCHDALTLAGTRAGITLADIDHVILAGGSTHLPLVREMLTAELCSPAGVTRSGRARCHEPFYQDVETIVALGAAVRAAAVGGLAVQDPARRVRVSLYGKGAMSPDDADVSGVVEPLPGGPYLEGGTMRLIADGEADETEIAPGGAFDFTDLEITPGTDAEYAFEVLDAAGDLVATVTRPVVHITDEEQKPATVSAPVSKLAKALLLDVDRVGRAYRRELVPALADLPMSADFDFTHPGDTQTVLLPIYQGSKLIQEIRVPVPAATPRGTPVRLTVTIDMYALITVRGVIGTTIFDALVEQPPDRDVPGKDELGSLRTALEREFLETLPYLPAGQRNVAEVWWAKTVEALEVAVASGDGDQVLHQLEALENIKDRYDRRDAQLSPPKARFDELVQQCRSLNDSMRKRAADLGRPHPHEEHERSIEVQREHGEQAYRNSDQRAYADALLMLQDLYGHFDGLRAAFAAASDTRSPGERAINDLDSADKLAAQVLDSAQAEGRSDFVREIMRIRRHLTEWRPDAHTDPSHIQYKVTQQRTRLQQIRSLLLARRSGPDDPTGSLLVES